MTRDEWDDLWQSAMMVWPNGRLDIAVGDTWYDHVQHMPHDAVLEAFSSLARHSTFPPALAELIKATQDVLRVANLDAARRGLPSGDRTVTFQAWIDHGCPTSGRDDEGRITSGPDAHYLYLGKNGAPVTPTMAHAARATIEPPINLDDRRRPVIDQDAG